ncbi:MAG: DUF3035 domain-containing protein [Candidatus Puniceispirillales bacterium WSBS_2018_MAG_OTU23]
MTKKSIFITISLMGLSLLATGCSSFDKALGKTKTAPDEFQVVVRAPLTLPPSFNLRPYGAISSGETASASSSTTGGGAVLTADKVFTKGKRADASIFDVVFGTDQRQPDIRTLVDEETLGIQLDSRIPLDILLGDTPNVGPNLDAAGEAIRIRKALQSGEDVTASPTLAVDPVQDSPITVQ